MSLGTWLLLLHEVAPVFGRVFPNLHHISPVPRAPCAPCAPSHLRFPISIPCFTPCVLPPSLLALPWVNPYFLNIWLPLMHLPSEQYEPSPFLFPVFPKLRYTGSSPGPITFPPLPFPQVCRAGIEPSPCPRKCGTVRTALPSFNPRLGILAPCLWDCLVGVTAPLGSRIRAKVRTGTEIKPSSGSCRAYRAVGWGLEHPGLCPWQGLGMRRALISNPKQSMIP